MQIIDQYRQKAGVNFSLLKHYLKSPAHYRWAADQDENKPTEAMIIGKAIHCLILEPSEFEKRYAHFDLTQRPVPGKDFKTAANRLWRDQMTTDIELSGKTALDSEQWEQVQGMAESVTNCKAAMILLKGCLTEEIIQWKDKESGVDCKAIVDFNKHIELPMNGELKSMEDASPEEVSRFMAKWDVAMQLSMNADGLSEIHGKHFNCQFLIACEKNPPYVCMPYFVNEQAIEHGRIIYKRLLQIHKQCIEKNYWGGYEQFNEVINGVMVIDLPGYSYTKAEANKMLQSG